MRVDQTLDLCSRELFAARVDKVAQIRAADVEPYAYSFAPTHSATQLAAQFSELEAGAEDEEADVSVAGRIMTRRIMGKLAFFTVQDETGTFQLYLDKKRLKEQFAQVCGWVLL